MDNANSTLYYDSMRSVQCPGTAAQRHVLWLRSGCLVHSHSFLYVKMPWYPAYVLNGKVTALLPWHYDAAWFRDSVDSSPPISSDMVRLLDHPRLLFSCDVAGRSGDFRAPCRGGKSP